MMFRIFNKTKNTYLDGYTYLLCEGSKSLVRTVTTDSYEFEDVPDDENVVIEWDIGITDCNGQPIYEGDIVQYMDKTTKFIPQKESGKFMVGFVLKSDDGITGQMKSGIYQIVGNIHNEEK